MSILLISGVPGAGKTLMLVSEILKAVKSGAYVYTNVDGITVPGVLPLPDDWRAIDTTPALVAIDEAHQRWPATGKPGKSANDEVNDLDMHRHKGVDFIVATQFPTKVHHVVRQHIDEHRHLLRLSGASVATVYTWPYAVLDPNDRKERDAGDSRPFIYPKEVYPFYKSSTLHTSRYKFRIPSRLYMFGLVVLIAGYLVYSGFSSSDGMLGHMIKSDSVSSDSILEAPSLYRHGKQAAGGGSEAPPAANNSTSLALHTSLFGGCISSATACRCYSVDGYPYDLSFDECSFYIDNPMTSPLHINRNNNTRK